MARHQLIVRINFDCERTLESTREFVNRNADRWSYAIKDELGLDDPDQHAIVTFEIIDAPRPARQPQSQSNRYRITYRLGGQRRDRVDVLDLLPDGACVDGYTRFSGRPYIGTQAIPTAAIKSLVPVPPNTRLQVDGRVLS